MQRNNSDTRVEEGGDVNLAAAHQLQSTIPELEDRRDADNQAIIGLPAQTVSVLSTIRPWR